MPSPRKALRCLAVSVSILPLGVAAHAQQQGPTSPSGQQPPYQPKLLPLAQGRLTGHVICNDTHLPARGAVLTLMQSSEQDNSEAGQIQQGLLMTRSGIDGSFLIEHVPAGDYAVVTYFPGYLNLLDSPDFVLGQTGADAQSFLDAQKKMRAQLAAHGTVHVGGHGTQTSKSVGPR